MVKMIALRRWRGREGAVNPGDEIDVDEDRAKRLEGYETATGRILTPDEGEQENRREIRAEPRAVRMDDAKANAKGGPTVATRNGTNDRADTPAPEPDATDGARDLAAKHGKPLRGLTGTGKDGRITRADVAAIYGEPPATE